MDVIDDNRLFLRFDFHMQPNIWLTWFYLFLQFLPSDLLKIVGHIAEVRGISNRNTVREGYEKVQTGLLDYTLTCYPSVEVSVHLYCVNYTLKYSIECFIWIGFWFPFSTFWMSYKKSIWFSVKNRCTFLNIFLFSFFLLQIRCFVAHRKNSQNWWVLFRKFIRWLPVVRTIYIWSTARVVLPLRHSLWKCCTQSENKNVRHALNPPQENVQLREDFINYKAFEKNKTTKNNI